MSQDPAAPTGKAPSAPLPGDASRGEGAKDGGGRDGGPRGDRRSRSGRGGRSGRDKQEEQRRGPSPERRGDEQKPRSEPGRVEASRGERPRGGEPPRGGEGRREPPRGGEPQRGQRTGRPEGQQNQASPPGQGQPRGGEQRRGKPPRSGRSGGHSRPEPQRSDAAKIEQPRSDVPKSEPPRGDSTQSGSPSEPGERRRRRRRGRGGRGSERSLSGDDSRSSIPDAGEPDGEVSRRVAAPSPTSPTAEVRAVPARREEREDSGPVAPASARDADSDDDDAAGDIRRLRPISELELPPELPVRMANLCAIRFRPAGMIYELDCGNQTYEAGELVLCESERGQRVGRIEVAPRPRPAQGQRRRVLRKARPDEPGGFGDSQQSEREAYAFCKARLRELGLPMKLLQVEVQLGQKATFFFASEDRVDFRDLVRDLSQRLRLRVEMRQVGARDGAKAIGGIGSCGRELCCSTFLPAFQPISIRMAKDQGMVLNPSKLAGQCGRLKCCLIYEHSTYKELGKTLPKVGKKVITPDGIGRVLDLDILKQRVRVYLEEGGAKSYAAAEVRSANPPQGGSHNTPTSNAESSADDIES
jgi:cell fate regulator YaaT (PSP1 superfamily)